MLNKKGPIVRDRSGVFKIAGAQKRKNGKAVEAGAKTDRRVLQTRSALGDALVQLMQEKDFEKIKVQEVLDRAGVGRSTFYSHYRDKEDLFVSDVEDFFEMFSTQLKRRGADAKRLAPVREFCVHLREVRKFYAAMVEAGKIKDVMALGQGFLARSIDERLRTAGFEKDPVRRAAKAHALAGSLFSLIDWWVDKGMKSDPQAIDDLFHRMAWSGLGSDNRTETTNKKPQPC